MERISTSSTPGRAALAALFLSLAGGLSAETPAAKPGISFGTSATLERGRYLVSIMGCGDCHTPMKMGARGPEPDLGRFLSGHPAAVKLGAAPQLGTQGWLWAGAATNTAFAGPWGTSYAINLTSDATGLGSWTEENFLRAMKEGRHLGVGRPIQPPMPWQAFARATEDDLRAIFSYLRTVPPVKNVAPEYRPPATASR